MGRSRSTRDSGGASCRSDTRIAPALRLKARADPLDLLLPGEEVVEPADRGGNMPLHRPRAVEDEGDFGGGGLDIRFRIRLMAQEGKLPRGQPRTAPLTKSGEDSGLRFGFAR
jgi:hypothetical protein